MGLKFLDNIEFPDWDVEVKPRNDQFLSVKLKKIEEVFGLLDSYFFHLAALEGLKGKTELLGVMQGIVKNLIAYIWDLPASQSYHHAARFGLLKHSLEVAYIDAEKALKEVAINSEGVPSVELTKKEKTWRVLAAWLIGLCHDLGKVFDVDLFWEGYDRYIYYHPLRGGILDFKLTYPQNLTLLWRKGRGVKHIKRNMLIFFTIVPFELLRQMPQNLLIRVLDGLYSYRDSGDAESVKYDTEESNKRIIISVIKKLGQEEKFKCEGGAYVFKLSDDIYAVVSPIFFQMASSKTGEVSATNIGSRTIEHIFHQYDWLYGSGDKFYDKFKIWKNKKLIELSLAFVKKEVFELAGVDSSVSVKFPTSEYDKLRDLIGMPKLEWFQGEKEEIETLLDKIEQERLEQESKDEANNDTVAVDKVDAKEDAIKKLKEEQEKLEQVIVEGANKEDNQGEQVQDKQDKIDIDVVVPQGVRKIVKKIIEKEYVVGRLDRSNCIGVLSVKDEYLWCLYPKVIDENFDLKMNLDENRKEILKGLSKLGFIKRFENKEHLFWFFKTEVVYYKDYMPTKSPLANWIRFDLNKLKDIDAQIMNVPGIRKMSV